MSEVATTRVPVRLLRDAEVDLGRKRIAFRAGSTVGVEPDEALRLISAGDAAGPGATITITRPSGDE